MNEIEDLLTRLDDMPHGSAQLEAARELWDRARQEADPELQFRVLSEVLKAAVFSGGTALFLALFPQFSRLKKDHPQSIDLHDYVWRLKWLIVNLSDFPEIPAQRIRQAEKQYAEALAEIGGAPRTEIYLRWKNAYLEGRIDDARALLPTFINLRRDGNSDCVACEVNALSYSATWMDEDYARAREIADPIVKGSMRCGIIPEATYAHLAFHAWRAGDPDAAVFHRKGYSLIRGNMSNLGHIGDHFLYLAGVRDADRFLRLLRVHLPWMETNSTPINHLDFTLGVGAGCRMIAQTGQRKRAILLSLPQKLRQAWGNEPRSAEELAELFLHEARALATAFDQRNGNDCYSRLIERRLQQLAL